MGRGGKAWMLGGAMVFSASLKGLGHAILGNFSTDQMVIELTKM